MARGGPRTGMGYAESPEDFWGALRGVWFSPIRFFRGLDPEGGVIRPTIFASLVLYLNLILEAVLQMAWLHEFNYGSIYAPLFGLVISVLLAPLLIVGFAVLVQVILGGGTLSRDGFGPLYRALSYAGGIALVLWIPFAPLIAIPYGAFVVTVAVRETGRVSSARAVAATLLPLGAVILTILLLLGPDGTKTFLLNPPGG